MNRAAEVTAQICEYELFFLSASKAHLVARRCPPKRDVARAVWDRSCAELQTGVLEEWFTREQLDERFGTWSFMARFAVRQLGSAGWRAVDDGTCSGHNGTFSLPQNGCLPRVQTYPWHSGAVVGSCLVSL